MEALLDEPTQISGESGNSILFQGESQNTVSGRTSTVFDHSMNEQVRNLLQKLNELKNLGEAWDSYNAAPPSQKAISNTRAFILENHFLALPFYFLAPGVNGEVMIEFKQNEKAAELYFNEDGTNELLLFRNDELELESTLEHSFGELIDFFNP